MEVWSTPQRKGKAVEVPMMYARIFFAFSMWSLFAAGALLYEFPDFYRSLNDDLAFYAGLYLALLTLVNGVLGYLVKTAYWIEEDVIKTASGIGIVLAFLFLLTLASS